MINSESEEMERMFAYNAGWNQAARLWDDNARLLDEPTTPLNGSLRESFEDGFRASQDSMILARAERREGMQRKYF